MTSLSRRLNLPAHGAVEVASGMALMAPPLLEFGAAGLIVSACLGAIQIGVATRYVIAG